MAEKPKVILPEKGKKNILITSALPYVNNVPHLGNIIGSVLSADCFSRYSKLRNRPTLFVCGTDEYGTATETKAHEEKVTERELCDKYAAIHKRIYDWFEISFDTFGRTSTQKQTEIVQEIFLKLQKNGYLEERTTTQPYCEKHGGFLADRYVEGTCPRCGYEDARGDQCDKCGNLLDPFELINPRCKLDGVSPVPRETAHMFLRLDKLQPAIEKWFNKSSADGWQANGIAITKSWLDKGLEARSITRDLRWGVPIPLPGYEKKVIYVWFDACIGYVSITANYTDEWRQWWQNPDEVTLYQFMGKDNTPFHSVVFPGTELGTGDPWTLVNNISTTEYLNYEKSKFSKSRGVGVFGDSAKDVGVPPSVWRYYMLANRPETGDTQFEWANFVAANNNELLANLGNFVNRVIKFAVAKFDSAIPDFSASYTDDSFDFPGWIAEIDTALGEFNHDLEHIHLRSGLKKVMEISTKGNLLLQGRVDNANLAAHPERTKAVVGLALNLSLLLASLCSPYMPSTGESIVEQLRSTLQHIPDKWDPELLKPGHKLGKPAYLFTRIDEKKVEEWKERYGGTQASREAEAEAKRQKAEEKEREKERRKAKRAAAKEARGEAGPSGTAKADEAKAVGDEAKGEATPDAEHPTTTATEERKQLPIRDKDKPVEK